jgi:hypothetical protein
LLGDGLEIVRVIFGLRRNRGFRKRSGGDVAFITGGGADFYVAFDAIENLDRVAALEFGFDVEVDKRFVDPDAIFIGAAAHADGGRGAGLRR